MGVDVEGPVVGVAGVVHDQTEQIFDRLVVAIENDRRNPDAFRMDVPCDRGEAARRGSADIHPMAARHRIGDDLSLEEDRPG